MVLILLIILASIAVAISMIHSLSGSLASSGIAKESIAKEGAEQSAIASPSKQFLVVVLPDGRVVDPTVAHRF